MVRIYNGTVGNNTATATLSGFWPFRFWDSWRMYGGGGSDKLTGGAKNDILSGDRYSSGALSAFQGNDTLYGMAGNDTLYGHGGNDYLDGGTGNDYMYGGTGNDTYVVNSVFDRVTEYSGQGTDLVKSTVSYRLGNYVENLDLVGSTNINGYGNNLANRIYGSAGSNRIYAYGGNDYITAGAGNDYIDGGTGSDTMYGGTGNDTYVVNSVFDRVVEYAGQGNDLVKSTISYRLGNYVNDLDLVGSTNINGYGNNLSNDIYGSAGSNRIYAYGGNDYVTAGAGNDYIDGGSGNDNLIGGTGNDTLVGGTGNDRLTGVDTGSFRPGRGEIDTLTSGSLFDKDVFVLGQNGKVFYDGGPVGADYAVITDFDKKDFFGETAFDQIQLARGSSYRLGSSGNDTKIYKDNLFGADELIGIVKNVQGLSLANPNHFVYS